ncbi:MAG: hypothetical protein PHF79_00435 [Candidatus Pacebacteria bacterium]|nr:hypothetical protein [Candidatus Paceibacterota bacterium]
MTIHNRLFTVIVLNAAVLSTAHISDHQGLKSLIVDLDVQNQCATSLYFNSDHPNMVVLDTEVVPPDACKAFRTTKLEVFHFDQPSNGEAVHTFFQKAEDLLRLRVAARESGRGRLTTAIAAAAC